MAGENDPEGGRKPLSEAAVSDYLLANPEFFQTHKTLLAKLVIPHPAGGAVSLVERQVEVLRRENRRLERRLVEWMETARENDRLLEQLHRLAVVLLAQPGCTKRLEALARVLREGFQADASAVILHEAGVGEAIAGTHHLPRDAAAPDSLKGSLDAGRPACSPLTEAQSHALFPDADVEPGSAAFIPIAAGGTSGLLLVGSADPKHFHPGLDTAYLLRLGELAEAALGNLEK